MNKREEFEPKDVDWPFWIGIMTMASAWALLVVHTITQNNCIDSPVALFVIAYALFSLAKANEDYNDIAKHSLDVEEELCIARNTITGLRHHIMEMDKIHKQKERSL